MVVNLKINYTEGDNKKSPFLFIRTIYKKTYIGH